VTKVKICGITRREDLETALRAGADYVGFVLYPESPRYISPSCRKKLLSLVKNAKSVAVVVNPSRREIEEILKEGFDLVQLHGEEDFTLIEGMNPRRFIKAFRIKGEEPPIDDVWKKAYAILLDTYVAGAYGGSGQTFNWEVAKKVANQGFRVFLAGGLTPENVKKALRYVNPYAVDVSSGVEMSKGIKDPQKIIKFIRSVRL